MRDRRAFSEETLAKLRTEGFLCKIMEAPGNTGEAQRKLAQTVKAQALRYARDILQVKAVKTHHNSNNDPMIAIDRKLGYVQTLGNFTMEKTLA